MYKEYSPCSVLAPFIYHFWEYKGETRSGLKFNIPPHGCSDLVFIVGNAADCIRNSLIMKPYHSYFFVHLSNQFMFNNINRILIGFAELIYERLTKKNWKFLAVNPLICQFV